MLCLSSQKHLGMILDKELNFNEHLDNKISKANKGIGMIRKLHHIVPRKTLLNIYKSYIRPHLDYGDVIFDQPHNDSFCKKIESVQYNASLAITGAIRGTSRERIYKELGLESLRNRRWYRRLCLFFKITQGIAPEFLTSNLPNRNISRNVNRSDLFKEFFC